MRKKRNWTQAELAKRARMKQARISILEQADYENFSFSTLKRIAAAFDVGVIIDFVSFPDFLKWSDSINVETVVPENFEESVRAQNKNELNQELERMLKAINLRQPVYNQPKGAEVPVRERHWNHQGERRQTLDELLPPPQ